MTFSIHITPGKAAVDAMVDLVDAGSAAGTLVIYDDDGDGIPADSTVAIGAAVDVLSTHTLPDPAFGAAAVVGGNAGSIVATAGAITNVNAAATGTATFFRILDSDSNVIFQGKVGTSGVELNLITDAFISGQTVNITALTVAIPLVGATT